MIAVNGYPIPSEGLGVMSIGSIQHWTDYLTGSVSLPMGGSICDGSTISDAGSPLNGEALPDLEGDFRFLRGSGTSGTLQADQLQDHVAITIDPIRLDLLTAFNHNRWSTWNTTDNQPNIRGIMDLKPDL